MKNILLITAGIAFVVALIFGAGAMAFSDTSITLGEGANSEAIAAGNVLNAEADAIRSETVSKAAAAETERQDREELLNQTRDDRAAKTNRINKSFGIAGAVALAISLVSLGIAFGGHSLVMGLVIVPTRKAISPISGKIGKMNTLFFPTMNRAIVHDPELKGQYGILGPEGFLLHEGDPQVSIEATRARALVDASANQSRGDNPAVSALIGALSTAIRKRRQADERNGFYIED